VEHLITRNVSQNDIPVFLLLDRLIVVVVLSHVTDDCTKMAGVGNQSSRSAEVEKLVRIGRGTSNVLFRVW
jgi:hypothetical protein